MARRNGSNGKRPRFHIIRGYRFIDKDPVIDKVRTMIADEGIREDHAALISGISATTTRNWFHGDTKRPQWATVAAVVNTLGYDLDFKKRRGTKLDVEQELEKAAQEALERKKNPHKMPDIEEFRYR